MKTAIISHPDCTLHEMGSDHPEQPARIQVILDKLFASDLAPHLLRIDTPLAKKEDILRVHSAEYLSKLHELSPETGLVMVDPDTAINPDSINAAYRAAGALVRGVDLLMQKEAANGFCVVRPPGHHAEPDHAMGFCIFNNVAVGATYAMEKYGLERVAILDFDVHHGNGTESMFAGDPRVLFCSTFQHPFYPLKPFATDEAQLVNVPLSAGLSATDFRRIVEDQWLSALEEFRPQFIFISAGFDAHIADPLAQLNLEDDDYRWLTSLAMEVADTHAEGRVLSTLEGGYNLRALASSALAHVTALTS